MSKAAPKKKVRELGDRAWLDFIHAKATDQAIELSKKRDLRYIS